MSFAGIFQGIARTYGETVALYRDGALLGTGKAVLRPLLDEDAQFVPTRLGIHQAERVLCLAERALPFAPEPGETVLRQGDDAYDVRNVRAVKIGEETVYWRAVLTRRDEEEA